MGWVAGRRGSPRPPRPPAASASSPRPPWTSTSCAAPIDEVKERTDNPFGVNLRADQPDIGDRIDAADRRGREGRVLRPGAQARTLIEQLHDGGVLVMPSIGAKRHAEKVLEWGVDAVLVQGGEGGGHTGSVPTTLLLPQVVDAVRTIPVHRRRRLLRRPRPRRRARLRRRAASPWAPASCSPPTAPVPDAVKQLLPRRRPSPTRSSPRRSTACRTGCSHRARRRARVGRGTVAALPARDRATRWRFRKLTGIVAGATMVAEGLAMRKTPGPHLEPDADGGQHADAAQGGAGRRQASTSGVMAERPGRRRDRRPADLQGADRPHRRRGRRRSWRTWREAMPEPRVLNGVDSVKAAVGRSTSATASGSRSRRSA